MKQENELEVVSVRLIKEYSLYSEKELTSPRAVAELMTSELAQYDREVLCILNMNTKNQVINMSIVSMGTLDASIVSPREVFKCSILSNAASIIALHNHPSGSVEPSTEDVKMTKKLVTCGELLDIPLLDHIIVGGMTGKTYSFRSENIMEGLETTAISTLNVAELRERGGQGEARQPSELKENQQNRRTKSL